MVQEFLPDVSEDDEEKLLSSFVSFNDGLRNDGDNICCGERRVESDNDTNVDDGNDSDSTFVGPAIDNPYGYDFYMTRSF